MDSAARFTFIENGLQDAGVFFPPDKCRDLQADVLSGRDLRTIFLTEAEFRANPQRTKTNPRPGRNLLAKLETRFIFFDERFNGEMTRVMGSRWRVLDYILVAAIPTHFMPEWVRAETLNVHANNLGPYVREEYRDVTYFNGIDFHQDILDFPYRECDFITAYVYLDDVATDCSPLYVMPNSQELGVTVFPHRIERTASGRFRYENDRGTAREYDAVELLGTSGTLHYWHAATLHGTLPQTGDRPRVSVRLLIEKNSKEPDSCELDAVNSRITGDLSLRTIRRDLNADLQDVLQQNLLKELAERPARTTSR